MTEDDECFVCRALCDEDDGGCPRCEAAAQSDEQSDAK